MAGFDMASPSRVHEIMREQKAYEAALVADEKKRMEAKREESVKRAKVERSQDQARIVHQRLIAALFGKSVTQWGKSENAMYEQIVAWLEAKQ
jgi:hypothetical protein